MNMAQIVLPPMNVEQEAKTKRLCEMIGEYMGDPVKCESVISMRIMWPDDRADMGLIFKKLAGNKNVSNKPTAEKGKDDLVYQAIEILKGEKIAYTKNIQQQLHIGWDRAVSLMDELEKMGILGPGQAGIHGREVLAEK